MQSSRLPASKTALLYHAHHIRHMEDLPFWLSLARRQTGPILELGCGTGRILLPLVEAGWHVFGLDNDPNMLALLRQNLPSGLASSAHLIIADLAAFHLNQSFSLVLLPCNTLSTLSSESRQAMFACVWRHLAPGGLFATSLPNPVLLKRLPDYSDPEVEEVFPHPADSEPVQVSSAWQKAGDTFHVFWHYDHLLPDGSIDRTSIQTTHHLTPASTYQNELNAAGFNKVVRYGDFDRSPYTRRSPSLILVVSRAS